MTLALLATLAFAPQPTTFAATDYFPLRVGRRMTYEEKSLQTGTTTDVVEGPVDIAGVPTIPIVTYQNGATVNTTFYRVDEGGVSIVANDKDRPLPKPLPILKTAGEEKIVWDFEGPGSAEKMAEPMVMKGEALLLKGERDVLGKKVPVLQVKILAKVGGGKASEEVEQISLYGKGIGLIESTSTTKIGKRKAVSTLKLLKIEEPKEGS